LRVEEDEPAGKKSQPKPAPAARVVDLALAAKNAKGAVRDLFVSLIVPHDIVHEIGRRVFVAPLADYVPRKGPFPEELKVEILDSRWRPRKEEVIKGRNLREVIYYEDQALIDVERFLKKGPYQKPPTDKEFLPRTAVLEHAETVLIAIKNYHASARESGKRQGDGWSDLEQKVNAALLNVQLDRVKALGDAKLYGDAFDLADRLADAHPDNKDVQLATGLLRIQESLRALDNNQYEDFRQARIRVENLERRFPEGSKKSPHVTDLKQRLREKAEQYRKQALKASDDKNTSGAVALIQMAESVWPQLSGLAEDQRRIGANYQVLYVGVRELPQLMSPALASTDIERQAVELIFEGLVRRVYDARAGFRYEPVLGRPTMTKMGRQFELTPNVSWNRDPRFLGDKPIREPLSAGDVRQTVHLLRRYEGVGNTAEWQQLIDEATVSDQDHVRIPLKRGYVDPLSMMTFKIVPPFKATGSLDRLDDPDFARDPIGTGPFQFQRSDKDATGRQYSLFYYNPRYKDRPGKAALPRLREIHFIQVDPEPGNLRSNFERPGGLLHLYLDLPSDKVSGLKKAESLQKTVTVYTLPTRRVQFLAVNHKNRYLENVSLRRAIAHAIDRGKILDECFRAGLGNSVHKVLNGPYPAGSWAYNPAVKADPWDKALASAEAKKAKETGANPPTLNLKYPDGDPAVASACEKIRDQLKRVADLDIILQAVPLRDFRDVVERDANYQLAYYHFDYPDDTYWLYPLFDPLATDGGRNFLNYKNDAELASLFVEAMNRREFAEVQKITHRIHAELYEKMPLIPLWQLDKHIAVHRDLEPVPSPEHLDPLLIFTQVEEWKVEKKE